LLLDAFAEAHRGQLAWRLVILGEGPERTMLEAKIRALGLEGYTLLPGVVSPIEDWLQHADLFVLSSRYEGFPNVLLEAMTCGLPVLAFDCASGPGEIIQSDVDGLLVPAGDVSALAAGLERLMHDTALRQRLGQAAKVSTQRYGLPQVMANWDALIDKAHLRGGDENGRNR
jgi:glycosyltransferase involved in cell wall biosynthesis